MRTPRSRKKKSTGQGYETFRDWLKDIFEIGYGPLGLKPRELGGLTPREVFDLLEGYEWRRREEYSRMAWLAAHLINATRRSGRAVQPRDLLPRSFYNEPPISIAEVQRELEEKRQRFEEARRKRS